MKMNLLAEANQKGGGNNADANQQHPSANNSELFPSCLGGALKTVEPLSSSNSESCPRCVRGGVQYSYASNSNLSMISALGKTSVCL